MSLFEELKRRNVFRVGIGYIVIAWLLLQVADLVLENVNAPDWVIQVFMLALALGFPLAVFFAWAFEMTPDGVKRESEVDRAQSITPQTGRKLDRSIMLIMAVALAWFGWDKFGREGADGEKMAVPTEVSQAQERPISESVSSVSNDKSLAVLPFVNMSDDKDNEYFSDGISEELLNVLVRVEGLRVPSRTSSFTFKDSGKKVTEIGRELQVDHVLEGSVRKAGDRIRVTAQLIDVNTDTHLWSETYTRKLDDIFAVQDEIAQAIVGALKVTLTGAEQKSLGAHPTENIDAYNKYLLGRHMWNQRSPASLLESTEPLREAVEMDPEYGQAWAALADAYVLIPEYGSGSIREFIPLAHDAISKALAINPESTPALTTSAYIKFMYDYDSKGAHADFKKAIEIDPGYATAHQWYGELLATQGQLDAALDQLMLARRADPLAPIIPHVMGWFLMFTDRKDEAFAYLEEALKLDPSFQSAIGNLATLNLLTGQYEQARSRMHELATVIDYDPSAELAVADALENPTLKKIALTQIAGDTRMLDGTMGKAFLSMLLNEQELALEYLEKAFTEGDPYAVHMKRISVYRPLHENPRFQAMLAKMNMWP